MEKGQYFDPEEDDLAFLVMKSYDKAVIVLFTAEWLGNSRIMKRTLLEVISDYPTVVMYGVDIEKYEKLSNQFNINQLPTTILLKNGVMAYHFIGLMPKKKIRKILDDLAS